MTRQRTLIAVVVAVVAVGVIIFGASVGTYNSLVSAQEGVRTAYSDIQTDLQRRSDLVPNLVATVQAYAQHEETVYTDIANARAALVSAGNEGNVQKTAEASDTLTAAVNRLIAIAEAYPELKSNQNFLDLQTQLEGTENRIAVARTKYNEAARDYNQRIRSFPTAVVASLGGFGQEAYFQASESAQSASSISSALLSGGK